MIARKEDLCCDGVDICEHGYATSFEVIPGKHVWGRWRGFAMDGPYPICHWCSPERHMVDKCPKQSE